MIDDIDAVCGRAKASGQDERIVLDHMLRFFDRLQSTHGLFLIAVTSQLGAIDPAILRCGHVAICMWLTRAELGGCTCT